MTDKELSIDLKTMAIHLGLCEEWQSEWREDITRQELLDKYFEGLDFPMRFHWPTNEYIKQNFPQDLLRKNNLLVDDTRSLLNPKQTVILGESKVIVRVNGHSSSTIYIRDNSSVKFHIKNDAFVIVHLFENAHVDIEVLDVPRVLVLKHSLQATVKATNGVKIKEELDYLK